MMGGIASAFEGYSSSMPPPPKKPRCVDCGAVFNTLSECAHHWCREHAPRRA